MKKVIFSPAFLVLWVVISSAISYSLLKSLLDIHGATDRMTELQTKNLSIEKNIDELKLKIADAETPFAKERIIREELGLQLPGETVVQLNQQEGVSTPSPTPSPMSSPPADEVARSEDKPIFFQWIELFFER